MAEINSIASGLAGLHHQVFGDAVDTAPVSAVARAAIPFKATAKTGSKYSVLMTVHQENGFSFGSGTGISGNLNEAVAGETVEALLQPYPKLLRVKLDTTAAERATGGKTSYVEAVSMKYENANDSMHRMEELSIFYGQSPSGFGEVLSTTVDGSDLIVTFTSGSFLRSAFGGRKGMKWDFYNSSGTKINTNAVTVQLTCTVASRQIKISGNATDLGNIAAGQFVVPAGAFANNFQGFDALCTSATVYGLTVANYELIKPQALAVDGPLTIGSLMAAMELAAGAGAENCIVFIPQSAYAGLNADQAGLTRYMGKQATLTNGAKAIELMGSSGILKVIPSIDVKPQEAFLGPDDKRVLFRGGTHEVTATNAFKAADWIRNDATDSYELRMRSDQFLACTRLGSIVKLTGLTSNV